MTPTYSGRPAIRVIEEHIVAALSRAGYVTARVSDDLCAGVDERLDRSRIDAIASRIDLVKWNVGSYVALSSVASPARAPESASPGRLQAWELACCLGQLCKLGDLCITIREVRHNFCSPLIACT